MGDSRRYRTRRKLLDRFRLPERTGDARQAVVVLGMHRSGTSALTRVLNLLGLHLPSDLLPESPDNERGYWESKPFVALNNDLLHAAGTSWYDAASIPTNFFRSTVSADFAARARDLIETHFADHSSILLKDPRMSRLVPFWQPLLEASGIVSRYLLILRHPAEVYQSFDARGRMNLPTVLGRSRSDLLWLRYCLEAERDTRHHPRSLLSYTALLSDWESTIRRAQREAHIAFDVSYRRARPDIDGFLVDRLRHHRSTDAEPQNDRTACTVYADLSGHVDGGADLDTGQLDVTLSALDAVDHAYAPLRDVRGLEASAEHLDWSGEILTRVDERVHPAKVSPFRVVFVSESPETMGHRYRVVDHLAALDRAGFSATWVGLQDAIGAAAEADLVIVARIPWSTELAALYQLCRDRGVRIGVDFDDLIFDPVVMNPEIFDHLRGLGTEARADWMAKSQLYRESVCQADFAVLTTAPLARAARRLGVDSHVLRNGIGEEMLRHADRVRRTDALPADGLVRVGYASGTPTHQMDFATIVGPLRDLLESDESVRLVTVGHLDITEYAMLEPYLDRIEQRPKVPHDQLFAEYARFDINLAPLMIGNPFCECKSELKYFESALVGVPTIAAATEPFSTAIRLGETGLLASTEADWRSHLQFLVGDSDERRRMGDNARVHALAAFGPEAQQAAARQTILLVSSRGESHVDPR